MRYLVILAAGSLAFVTPLSADCSESFVKDVPKPLWLTDLDVQTLRRDPGRTAALLKHFQRELAVIAQPVGTFEPPPHYAAKGSNETDTSRHLAGDGNMAWQAALCYAVTGGARFAHHAQSIVRRGGDTLVSVRSEQGSSEINFDLPAYVLAASLVRGVDDWNRIAVRGSSLWFFLGSLVSGGAQSVGVQPEA